MLYTNIVIISLFIVYLITLPLAINTNLLTLSEAIFGPVLTVLFVLVLLGLLRVVLRALLPIRFWNFKSKFFKVSKKEIQFYQKLKIKKWKDKVPELGRTSNFPKSNLTSFELDYLKRFLQETCFGERLHFLAALLPFFILFFVETKSFIYLLPLLLVNFVLHLLPLMIQRYVRFKLIKIFNKKSSVISQNMATEYCMLNKWL